MFLENWMESILPASYSDLDQIRAATVVVTAMAVAASMMLLILYWIITKSLETVKSVYAALGIILLLIVDVELVIQGHAVVGAWMLVIVMLLLNFASMLAYGIATSASSGCILPILLAMLCIGVGTGFAVTFLCCGVVFAIPVVQSKGWVRTILPYQVSNLTFDAPTLTLIYLVAAIITSSWASFITH
ncbi:hypothetical protein [Mycobacterium riyadhense]|uniref:hypothetical protein n=1 Tax=Mycobacterium riyadhense TaxID=486698 RepID=UPI00195A1593|nr:hypothetical protein [Mycobacterium riyadhense]